MSQADTPTDDTPENPNGLTDEERETLEWLRDNSDRIGKVAERMLDDQSDEEVSNS